MKSNSPKTYKQHLTLLNSHQQDEESDYGSYLTNSEAFQPNQELSSTLPFLLDFKTKTYPFLGDNIKKIMGHPKEAFLEGGLEFTLHQYKDFEILNKKIFPSEVATMKDISLEDLSQLRFSKTYRFKSERGEYRTMLQRNSIICARDQPLPVAIFGFITDITPFTEHGKVIHLIEKYDAESEGWTTIVSKAYYPDIDQQQLLSKREIEILKWSVEGLGSKQIADKLNISFNTVNTHRRNMLKRTNCRNSMELLRYAIDNKLL